MPQRFLSTNINYYGKNINLGYSIDEIIDLIVDLFWQDQEIEIELPDGRIIPSCHNVEILFQKVFGMSQEEWHQYQKKIAKRISFKELFFDRTADTVNAVELEFKLRQKKINGENVYVLWNGQKCYSVDSASYGFDFIKQITGIPSPEYKFNLKLNKIFIKSIPYVDPSIDSEKWRNEIRSNLIWSMDGFPPHIKDAIEIMKSLKDGKYKEIARRSYERHLAKQDNEDLNIAMRFGYEDTCNKLYQELWQLFHSAQKNEVKL